MLAGGRTLELRAIASGVNHGVGIYDGTLRLLAQVQDMPGQVQDMPGLITGWCIPYAGLGAYRLSRLEYCGLVHHEITAELKVTAAPSR